MGGAANTTSQLTQRVVLDTGGGQQRIGQWEVQLTQPVSWGRGAEIRGWSLILGEGSFDTGGGKQRIGQWEVQLTQPVS